MFTSIFFFEIKYWLKQPSTYVFMIIMTLLGTGVMAGYAGVFDDAVSTQPIPKLANSAINIHRIFSVFKELLLILLPIVFGQTIYRDFSSGVHSVFYSYPFLKVNFYLAKFLSAFAIMVLVSLFLGVGCVLGTFLPGVDANLLGSFSLTTYGVEYLVFVWPNILAFGMMIFVSVALSRNIYSGFVVAIGIVVTQQILGRLFVSTDNMTLFSLFDPFGAVPLQYYTYLWTVTEQNTLNLPVTGLVLYNRLIWLAIGVVIFIIGYTQFSFTQTVRFFRWSRAKATKVIKNNFGSVTKIYLPTVHYDFSFFAQLKSCWLMSDADFKYIIKSGPFRVILVIGFISVLFTLSQMNPQYATKLLPVTWLMLLFPVFFFLMVVNLLTFLYAGMLIQRARAAKMDQLLGSSPVGDWVLVVSKFFALVKMQVVLLALVGMAGLIVQTVNGFFDYNFGHYLFHLFVLNLLGCVIWACLAILMQTLFTNAYLGLFLLILGAVGLSELQMLGIENTLFRYNQNPDPDFILSYSDMGGYGAGLLPFLAFKIYWLIGGLILLFISWLFWIRGVDTAIKTRLSFARLRMKRPALTLFSILLLTFISLGVTIHYFDDQNEGASTLETDHDINVDLLEAALQPRVTDVKLQMDIYPKTRSFEAQGQYILINKTDRSLDSLIVSLKSGVISSYWLNVDFQSLYNKRDLDILELLIPLAPGDSLIMDFNVKNIPNTVFQKNSPIEENGTFLTSHMFAPTIGYRSDQFDIADASDSSALQHMYRSSDADFINFEAVVSTSSDQTAIAPGYLEKQWTMEDRNYFKYVSDSKVTNDYVFNSGVYDLYTDVWRNTTGEAVDLTIYHHPAHTYNLERMMNGLKAGLDYNSKYFAPYQHRQARIIEFSRSLGNYGQSYANTLPLSEMSFVADIDLSNEGSLDKLFGGIAHEIAHQWWGHQAIPAGVAGYAMITESMSEYVALKVIEHEYGKDMVRVYTKLSLEKYLKERGRKTEQENPLVSNSGQDEAHVPYEKGSLAMYMLSGYLGEDNFNAIIRDYLSQVRFTDAPYTTAEEMANFIIDRTPDSLKYLVNDVFKTVTLYDNKVDQVDVKFINPNEYHIKIKLDIRKFRSGESGIRIYSDHGDTNAISLPLKDYLEVGVFANGQEIYLKKHLFQAVKSELVIVTNQKPDKVAIDPYYKLIDTDLKDNYMSIQ
ncbi:MAG: M1 family aminopeptidase [Bacteroidota bacterium]